MYKVVMQKSILVTGGAGFIGSCFTRLAVENGYKVCVLDKLTYAGYLGNISDLIEKSQVQFIKGDIGDQALVRQTLQASTITAVLNFAAESHVDNSISGPEAFVRTNVLGTFSLLEAFRAYYRTLNSETQKQTKFVHISTDEVFGQLGKEGYFTEESNYQPNSPYSASKAASDHLARAWHHTYQLPIVVTNCSNNYGPRQFPEKLIPRMITCALDGQKLPVYGKGENIRDWIHVEDHSRGIMLALEKGNVGESYCFGGRSERTNLDVVKTVCRILDELKPRANGTSYAELISFVEDRKGHDFRYAIDDTKSRNVLDFKSRYENFEIGLKDTIRWYLDNNKWMEGVLAKK